MVQMYIKYFTVIACSCYIYTKLLNHKKKLSYMPFSLLFSSVLSFLLLFVWSLYQSLVIPVLIICTLSYVTLVSKTEFGLSFTTTIISFGISLACYLIGSLVASSLASILFHYINITHSSSNTTIILICAVLIQLILCYIPWRFRRLKSGMPFLRNKGGGNIGGIISTVLLCCAIVISKVNDPQSLFFIMPIIFIFVCGICILLWWRNRLQKAYIEKLRAHEIQSLRNAIQEKDKQIEQLKQNNDFLAKIIHKDNKLIPSMELAVREYLQLSDQNGSADIQIKGQMLLVQLKNISRDRSGIIEDYQSTYKKIPQTGVFPIDALMSYMFNKAEENGIKYDFTFSGSVKYLVENIITVSDLRTLLADLIENAIIATKDTSKKEILVSIGVCEGNYMVDVFDSGNPFEKEPLINFGRKKTTTHADTGGSGIGLMTVSQILRSYQASFIIEEFSNQYNIFTKKVSVKFDRLNQYIVKSGASGVDEIIRTISAG